MNKNLVYIISLSALILLIVLLKKFKPNALELTPVKSPIKMTKQLYDDFFLSLTRFVKDMEGGLTNNANDSASKFPSPTPQKYHTNKGITYKTFTDSSKVIGFTPSIDNFLTMPDQIWLPIFKNLYFSQAANMSLNPVLSGYMSLWYWGGWAKALMPIKRVNDVINDKSITDKQKLKKLTELRKEYFANVVKANPKNSVFLKGWNNRADKFYNDFNKYLN